jgi:hypothetical protein
MSEHAQAKKPAAVAPQQPTTQQFPRDVKQILQDYNWQKNSGPPSSVQTRSSQLPVPPSPAPSNYKIGRPPQSTRFATTIEEVNEDEDEYEDDTSSEEEEPIVVVPGKPKPASQILSTSAAPIKNFADDRVKTQERLQFSKSGVSTS